MFEKIAKVNPKVWAVVAVAAVAVAWVAVVASRYLTRYEPLAGWVYIPRGSSVEAVADSLCSSLGYDYGHDVMRLLPDKTEGLQGAYRVVRGERAFEVARRINRGYQTPVSVTFNNIRTFSQLADRIAARMAFTPDSLLQAAGRVAAADSLTLAELTAEMMPDTYELYWTATPEQTLEKLRSASRRFWNDRRRAQADSLGLTPVQVVTLASIVADETHRADEQGQVARLYLNRIAKKMPLQADPTVKFAAGDMAARRVNADVMRRAKGSPYNTYEIKGLPPGPIQLPEAATIDRVLTAPEHDYLYMCAASDFSGHHVFATDYAAHRRNAAAYRRALNKRGIK